MGVEVAIAMAAFSAYSANSQAQSQANIAEINADMAQKDAEYNAEKKKREYEKLKASQEASYSASGVKLEGTPAAVLAQTDMDAEMSAMEIIYGGQQESNAYQMQADNYKSNSFMNAVASGASTFNSMGGGQKLAKQKVDK